MCAGSSTSRLWIWSDHIAATILRQAGLVSCVSHHWFSGVGAEFDEEGYQLIRRKESHHARSCLKLSQLGHIQKFSDWIKTEIPLKDFSSLISELLFDRLTFKFSRFVSTRGSHQAAPNNELLEKDSEYPTRSCPAIDLILAQMWETA